MPGDEGAGGKPRANVRDLLGAAMPESNPLLCDPSEKDDLESTNGVDQLAFLQYLVVDLKVTDLRESHVLEMQKLAIQGIYPCAGTYRKTIHEVYIQRSRHKLPEPALVPGLVRQALDRVNEQRTTVSAIDRAAYLLWRINWIHPFPGGNGRTSRALAHLVLCIEHGAMLPGSPSVPTLIKNESEPYFKALQQADAADESGGENISLATELVLRTASQQLQSVVAAFAKPRK